jgi:hypothetical protein
MKRLAITLQLLVLLFVPAAGETKVVTFDDLTNFTPVPSGYSGLNWSNVFVLDTSVYPTPSGYLNATVSPDKVAFNGIANPATVSSNARFDLLSGHFTAAWRNDLLLTVTAYRGGREAGRREFFLNTSGPSFLILNLINVDRVVFATSGGTAAGYIGTAGHFVVDDLKVTVPSIVSDPGGARDWFAVPIESIATLQADGKLNEGQATSLTAKLQAARAALGGSNPAGACKLFHEAIDEVGGYIAAGILGPADGASLLDSVVQASTLTGCEIP